MRLILAPALLVLASVAPPLRAQPVELAQRRSELLRTVQRADSQMRNGSFAAAIAPLFAPNGIYSANLKTDLRGASGARTFWSRDTLNARSTGRWIVIRHDISADGRDGYTYGLFDVVRPSGDTLPGGFHAYWRRTDDGQWQILAMSRGRREPGATTTLPDSLRVTRGQPRSAPVRVDTIATRDQLFRVERAFSDSAARDVRAAFAHFVAPDGAKLDSAGYIWGPSAIGTLFQTTPPDFFGFAWYPEAGTVAASGDLGFTIGPVNSRLADGTLAPSRGNYFTIWQRQPDGSWRWVVD